MSSIISIYFVIQSLFAVQILQQSPDVIIQEEKGGTKNYLVKEGGLKFQNGAISYDLFAHSDLREEEGRFILEKGALRVRGEDFDSLKVETPVARVTLNGSDFIVEYAVERAVMTVTALKGSALLQGHYRDDILNIQESEKGEFVGVPEATGPAFDVLLKGRKAIRGQLSGPEKIDAETRANVSSKFEIAKRQAEKKSKPKPKPGQICVEPFAKFNECLWRCKNNPPGKKDCQTQNPKVECVREKCLANGLWGDRKILKGSSRQACKKVGESLAPCDY